MSDPTPGICGKTYWTPRRVNEFPRKETCTKPPHEGGRHGQAKAPPAADAEPSGTCQVCQRKQQTRAGRIVLHGYKRPGCGYIVGNCYAHGFAPWEVSCDRAKQFVAEVLKPHQARVHARLEALRARPDSVPYNTSVWVGYERTTRAERGYKQVTVQVARDAPEGWVKTDVVATMRHHYAAGPIVEVGDFNQVRQPGYDEVLSRCIADKESEARMVALDIQQFERRIAAWKPVPWPAQKVPA